MPKRTKRTTLDGESREFVIRLRDYFERENQNGGPLLPLSRACERVADALGIGIATVSRITKEKFGENNMAENVLSTPKPRKRSRTVTAINGIDAEAIRNHVNAYYTRNERPSLIKLSKSLKEANLFNGSIPSLSKILKEIGFKYNKIDKKETVERTHISLAQTDFLRKVNNISDGDEMVYLDETRLSENQTVSKTWTDDTSLNQVETWIKAEVNS